MKKINILKIEPIGDDLCYPDTFRITALNGKVFTLGKTCAVKFILQYLNCTGTIGDGLELIDKIELYEDIQVLRNMPTIPSTIHVPYYHIRIKDDFRIINEYYNIANI